MDANFDLFSHSVHPGKAKIILLGTSALHPEWLMDRVRSLPIEHVSPDGLMRREISRNPGSRRQKVDDLQAGEEPPVPVHPGRRDEAGRLALLRRWFFARKPDAGFVLADFPATLLQAKVFDEWLDARDERIDAVVQAPGASAPVVRHYMNLGLLSAPVA
jgi:adenylate kinase